MLACALLTFDPLPPARAPVTHIQALPFSIFIALTFYFSINPTIIPLTDHFAEHMIMM